MRDKLKDCPWCGWHATGRLRLDITDKGEISRYYVHCGHCGFASKKSRFKWLTRLNWNTTKAVKSSIRKEKRYHIYGEEF